MCSSPFGTWRLPPSPAFFSAVSPRSSAIGKNLCWVTKTCVTIRYMTERRMRVDLFSSRWLFLCSRVLKQQPVVHPVPQKKNKILPRILVVLKQTFKDILQVTLNVFLASVHAWNMLQMCIYRPDIIIMHIFYSTKDLRSRFFKHWA